MLNWLIFKLSWSIIIRADTKIKTAKIKFNGILAFSRIFAAAKISHYTVYVCYLERRHYTHYQCIINVLSTSVCMHRHHEIAPLN